VPRISASERLRRLLALIPWIADHPGAPIDEICARFEIDADQLRQDLEVVWMVGLPPYTPDQLIDVVVEDDRVWLHLGDFFASPLRLTADQALALVAAGTSLTRTPGTDTDGPLARGLAKLAVSIGLEPDEPMGVHLGDATTESLDSLRRAATERRRLEIDYYSFGRDELTTRRIDPYRVLADQGQWYVVAWCHRARGERLFRVDRVRAIRPTDERFEAPATTPGAGYDFDPEGTVVRLRLDPSVRWVVDQYPTVEVEDGPDGVTISTLAVSARPWLERLLLRLGPDARVLDLDGDPDEGEDVRRSAARRVLARYRDEADSDRPSAPVP
jgi:proteasome accessory factor C